MPVVSLHNHITYSYNDYIIKLNSSMYLLFSNSSVGSHACNDFPLISINLQLFFGQLQKPFISAIILKTLTHPY